MRFRQKINAEDKRRVHGAADEGYRSIQIEYRCEGANAGRDDGMTADLAARMHTPGFASHVTV